MSSFEELLRRFEAHFAHRHFPEQPSTLYDPAEYILTVGGKRIRPVLVLMANELFNDIHPDALDAATAIELFHNFTLIHDDIMDKAPLRRGKATVHAKYGENTALLAGDVMLTRAYDYLIKVEPALLRPLISLFNRTVLEVSEGQQLDMDFEERENVSLDEYIHMVTLKTSVLLGASLRMGAILGGASVGTCERLYAFGKCLGIAFQVQDDYLDAFGDPEKFGKQVGGDILARKKTFLLVRTFEAASDAQKEHLDHLWASRPADLVPQVLDIMKSCGADAWTRDLKEHYLNLALGHLEDMAVLSARKQPLRDLAAFLVQRDY